MIKFPLISFFSAHPTPSMVFIGIYIFILYFFWIITALHYICYSPLQQNCIFFSTLRYSMPADICFGYFLMIFPSDILWRPTVIVHLNKVTWTSFLYLRCFILNCLYIYFYPSKHFLNFLWESLMLFFDFPIDLHVGPIFLKPTCRYTCDLVRLE